MPVKGTFYCCTIDNNPYFIGIYVIFSIFMILWFETVLHTVKNNEVEIHTVLVIYSSSEVGSETSLNTNMTSLLEHSDAHPEKYRFLLKFSIGLGVVIYQSVDKKIRPTFRE